MAKIAFTTCADAAFIPGVFGLVRSIRRFHDDADIWVFIEDITEELESFGSNWGVNFRTFAQINPWIQELLYSQDRYRNDASHYYHPGFANHISRSNMPPYAAPPPSGFGMVHHLHPLNVKAYCTGWCLLHENCENVVHLDSDAFLLGPVTQRFAEMSTDSVLAFDDGHQDMPHLEKLFGCTQSKAQEREHSFNAGVVFYKNGSGVREMIQDFMFYIDSCYHYTLTGNDQGMLRYLVSKFHLTGKIHYRLADRTNWNPTWSVANKLRRQGEIWINERNSHQQFIWHGAGGCKPWQVEFSLGPVLDAWGWIGGLIKQDYASIHGNLIPLHCEKINSVFLKDAGDRNTYSILEIGGLHGRTAVANCVILGRNGVLAQVEVIDISQDNILNIQTHAKKYNCAEQITTHKTDGTENILRHVRPGAFDACFIDGDHSFKHVLADIEVCRRAVRKGGLIAGDDYQLPQAREAIDLSFRSKTVYSHGGGSYGIWWAPNR